MGKNLRIVGELSLPLTSSKSTLECFAGNPDNREQDLDRKLPVRQRGTPQTDVTVIGFTDDWLEKTEAMRLLGLESEDRLTDRSVGNLLVELGHTLTLPQMEAFLAEMERIGPANVIRGIQGNFNLICFTPTEDPSSPVATLYISYKWEDGVEVALYIGFLDEGEEQPDCYLLIPNFKRRY